MSPRNRTQIVVIAVFIALATALAAFFQSRDDGGARTPPQQAAAGSAQPANVSDKRAAADAAALPSALIDGFTIVDGAYREFDGLPAFALSFSQPLDVKKDYGNFIQVLEMKKDSQQVSEKSTKQGGELSLEGGEPVSGAWAFGENPRILFFSHVKPATRYVVRVLAGLPAGNATKLTEEARFSIQTEAVTPSYYFASRGTVLPAEQNGGLPVVTVNVPEVDIQFLKVRNDKLPDFLGAVITGRHAVRNEEGEAEYEASIQIKGLVDSWSLENVGRMTESVFTGRFLTEQKANRRSVTFIQVENIPALREPGVYVAVMSRPNHFSEQYQTTYFYVSDLGLHIRRHPNRASDVFVSSLTSGKGVAGVEVSWINEKARTLSLAETDPDGYAPFKEPLEDARIVVAKKGGQMSLVALKEPALDLSEFDTGGFASSPVRLFAWSGRDLYRPGESFEVSALARDMDGQTLPPQPIQAIFRRPDGKAQWTETWQPDKTFNAYYRRKIELPVDAPTGFWNLELRSDPAAKLANTVMRIGVEEFLPERMKLDLSSESRMLGAGDASDSWRVDVSGTYLYGAPASGNRLLGAVNIVQQPKPLDKKLPGFIFGDSSEDSVHIRSELDETVLDGEGKASFDINIADVRKRLSPFSIRATVSLLESGGRPAIRSIERIWWPAPVLVGLRPLFTGVNARENSMVGFDVVRADAEGNLKALQALPVRLFREDRNYYWRFDDNRGWHSGFTETDELLLTTRVDALSGGHGKITVPVEYGRYRLEVLDPETGLTARYRFYAGWNAQGDESLGIRPDRVAVKFDKPAYAEGETVKLTLTPPHAGEALITLEGGGLLWKKRLSVGAGDTVVEIPLKKEWKRHDLYVTVMVLRPGIRGKVDGEKIAAGITPARALGLAHLPLDRGARKLSIALEAPQKMEPERTLKVKVKAPEAKGKTTLLTLSAVDTGILNITRFASPDPFGFYFGKLRYGQDMYDVYGRLIEKMAGRKGKLKWGGDSSASPQPKEMPKKVRLVDLFSGPLNLNADGEAEVELSVPDFNGALRLMAVVAGDGHYGMQEAEVVVAAPLIVELNTPRFLSIGDSALLALDVQNLSGAAQDVRIDVSSSGGLKILGGVQKLALKDQEKKILRIPVTGEANGLAEIRVKVDSPRRKINRTFPLQVQAPTPRQSIIRNYLVAPGEVFGIKESALGGFLRQTVAGTLLVSNQPPIDVRSAVQGLLRYPYGCTEQTVSTAYPHVFIGEEDAKRFGLKAFSLAERAAMLDKAIGRLAGMQAPGGGFSLWRNASNSVSNYQYWLSAYVAHFLLDAREQGFSVPVEMENKAIDFLLKGLQEGVAGLPRGEIKYDENLMWRDVRYAGPGRFGVLAYGAYVLARHGKAPLSTLRQIFDARKAAYSGLSLVHLGLALHLAGDEKRAKEAVEAGVVTPRRNDLWWGDYGSNVRDWAQSHVLLRKHGMTPEGWGNLVSQVAKALEQKRYLSTQEQLAVFLLGRDFSAAGVENWSADFLRKGRIEKLTGSYVPLEADDLVSGVHVRNTHSENLYAQLTYAGNPEKTPPAKNDIFELTRHWYHADGSPLSSKVLRAGETLIVRLTVGPRGGRRIANALVVDYIPAGFEIENANIVQGERETRLRIDKIDVEEAGRDSRIKHLEFRDDRFVASLMLDRTMNLFYRVRVVTPGKFIVPQIYAEDMYQPAIYGLSDPVEAVTILDGMER
ncbi:MAG: alpha-2-macroglobulin family protein [Candidatus Accumulibacter sp.]|nr:alpha-2-macroglobulin family protein [Accumulibacter sp.]